MHRMVLGEPSGLVDHVNGDGLDNRKDNLRKASLNQNQWNRRIGSNNTSGFKGVRFRKPSGRWSAEITLRGKTKYLGSFRTKEAAAHTYDAAAIKYFGEFARLNFPNEHQNN